MIFLDIEKKKLTVTQLFMEPLKNKSIVTDEQLMQMVITGNKKAFYILVDRWQKPIINFFYKHLSDKETSEDLTQEVFINIFKAKKYDSRAPFYGWIYRISRNKLIDFQRRKKLKTVILDNNPEVNRKSLDSQNNPENLLLKNSENEIVIKLISELPEEQQTAIILSKYQKLSNNDIAKVMNCSDSAAKVRVFRAIKSLVKRFKELYEN